MLLFPFPLDYPIVCQSFLCNYNAHYLWNGRENNKLNIFSNISKYWRTSKVDKFTRKIYVRIPMCVYWRVETCFSFICQNMVMNFRCFENAKKKTTRKIKFISVGILHFFPKIINRFSHWICRTPMGNSNLRVLTTMYIIHDRVWSHRV